MIDFSNNFSVSMSSSSNAREGAEGESSCVSPGDFSPPAIDLSSSAVTDTPLMAIACTTAADSEAEEGMFESLLLAPGPVYS